MTVPNLINTRNHDQAGNVLHVGGMTRVTHVIEEVRGTYGDPSFLKDLELAAGNHKDYLGRATPGTYDVFVARMGG